MAQQSLSSVSQSVSRQHEKILQILSAGTFLIFFQAYTIAPLIPFLTEALSASEQIVGLAVPAYLIPYGIASLIYGVLSDYIGRRQIMITSLIAFAVLTMMTASIQSSFQLLLLRSLTGLGASGFIPLVLTMVGDLFPERKRGRAIGWIFASMAGGMASGSTLGAVLVPFVGWRGVFIGVGVCAALILFQLYPYRRYLGGVRSTTKPLGDVVRGYQSLLGLSRGQRTYGYVLLNGIFHSGVFTWLGLYFSQQYNLGTAAIGLALLGYGVPGLLFSPAIGRAADRWGRRWLLAIGFLIAGISAGILALDIPLAVAVIAVTTLSLGYDMTQPLLAGIITSLGGSERRGQAMGLNVFTLFIGFGLGSLLFGELVLFGITTALLLFSTVQLAASLLAVYLFRHEKPN
jgi:predicted MFS family arabinose efflux permease